MGDKCAHRNCSCGAADGDQYCSQACAAQPEMSRDCECGHAGCTGSAVTTAPADRDVQDRTGVLADMPHVVNPVI